MTEGKNLARIKTALLRLNLLLAIYTFLRIVFFVLNSHVFNKYSTLQILESFISGLRFDLSAILFLNAGFLILSLIAPNKIYNSKNYQLFLKAVFALTNIPFILANLADSEYYKFTGNRMTKEILFLKSEAAEQIDQFVFNYWHIVMLAVVCTFVPLKFYPKAKNSLSMNFFKKNIYNVAMVLGILLVIGLGIRGGTQSKPLQPAHAYATGLPDLGVLTLNSTFTLLKSKKVVELKRIDYFSDENQVLEELKQNKLRYDSKLPPQNVVLIILESFATEFWGAANTYPGFTPFLDSLTKKGLFFKNNYASGRRSIEAFPAILFGLPVFMTTPIVKTNFYSNRWDGVAELVKKHNYHASFFHGAHKGTMYFDVISALAGFEDYYPQERYPGDDSDGNWGVYDEPFMQYMVKEVNKHPQPFLSILFTLSTHQPYHVPEKYKDKFPKGTLKIHESVGYVDDSLRKFFESASKEPWFENTLFVITGDHTQMSESEHYNSTLGEYRVPLLLYHPKKKLETSNPNRVTQHTDIVPTILDFLGIHNESHLLFGRSVFDETQEGEAIFYAKDSYWLVRENHFIRLREVNQKSALYDINDPHQSHPIMDNEELLKKMDTRLRAYIQLYRNGLLENKLYQ